MMVSESNTPTASQGQCSLKDMYLLSLVESYQDGIRSRAVHWDILLRHTLTLGIISS